MYYLNLDKEGWLLSVSTLPMTAAPSVESLAGLDLTGVRMGAYRWDGAALALDPDRLERLEAEQAAEEKAAWEQRQRAGALAEVQAALAAAQINAIPVDDATALRWRLLYPEWAAGTGYEKDEKVRYGDRLYKCLQPHTAQAGWEPPSVPALWTEISETHAGTADDPIPYNGNMALEAGRYYAQDGVAYRCTRDTGIPVYSPLADLVGLYVELV